MYPKRKRISFTKLLLIPLAFFVKDMIATQILLAQEPGITGKAAFYFALALLPGTLVFKTGSAIPVNAFIGLVISVIIYVVQDRRRTRLR